MPCRIGLTALSKALYVPTKANLAFRLLTHLIPVSYRFCFCFFSSPILALTVNVPTRSADGQPIYFTWNTTQGDPDTIYMNIQCSLKDFPQTPVRAKTSDLYVSLNLDPLFLYVFQSNTEPFSTLRATQVYIFTPNHVICAFDAPK
jgi:hypothetical protein